MLVEPAAQTRVFAVDVVDTRAQRHVDARFAQEREPHLQREIVAAERRVECRAQPRQVRAEDAVARHLLQRRQPRLGGFERARHELRLAAQHAGCQTVFAGVVVAEKVERRAKQAQGRMVRRRRLRLAPGIEIEAREGEPLVRVRDDGPREIDLHGHREHIGLRGAVREHPPRDLQMQRRTVGLRDRRIRRLADAVVPENPVLAVAVDAARFERGMQALNRIAGGQRRGDGEHVARCAVAKASQRAQHALRGHGQLLELVRQQFDDVVCAAMAHDAFEMPSPRACLEVVFERAFVGEHAQQMTNEERIAPGLAADFVGQRRERVHVPMQRQRDQFAQRVVVQRSQLDAQRVARLRQRTDPQRMIRADFVAPECADEQQRRVRVPEQPFEHMERADVRPLQVVEQQHERTRGRRETRDQARHALQHLSAPALSSMKFRVRRSIMR